MLRRFAAVLPLLFVGILPVLPQQPAQPLTAAERTDYKATSSYAEVVEFVGELQRQSVLVRVESLGRTAEGREIPLMIIGDPPPASPLDLRSDGRLPVYIQANIHAGEVEGKEATLMFARDCVLKQRPRFFDRFVLLIVPIFNADGNDRFGKNRHDNGPELAGERPNGMNLDLNRDGVKMESPEVRGLMARVINRWDPILFLDCHTTNGSLHREPVTYSWGLHPNTDPEIMGFMRDVMMPAITRTLRERYSTLAIPYGNFVDPKNPSKGWEASEAHPRYLTNYMGLRNRLSLLLENYSYADFATRVKGNYNFLQATMEFLSTNRDRVVSLLAGADRATVERGRATLPGDSVACDFALRPLGRSITIEGYAPDTTANTPWEEKPDPTRPHATYSVPLIYSHVPIRSVRRPFAYCITVPDPAIVQKLRDHGLLVERLTMPETLEVEKFLVKEIKGTTAPYQGHYCTSIGGDLVAGQAAFPAGSYWVTTAQPLGNVAVTLLEPMSNDGLITWNFFDRYLNRQWSRNAQPCPIYRIPHAVNPARETVR